MGDGIDEGLEWEAGQGSGAMASMENIPQMVQDKES